QRTQSPSRMRCWPAISVVYHSILLRMMMVTPSMTSRMETSSRLSLNRRVARRRLSSSGSRMITEKLQLHHVGIIVHDLDEAVCRYERLGFQSPARLRIPDQQ